MQLDVLGERYQIQDPIGRGGMATIYRGRDMRTDRIVAIKILREVYSTDPKFVTRFQREAKAASSLQHPNIVQVYDYGQSEGNYFIVMECIEGTDLRRYLRSRGVLAVDRAVIIAHDVALGLGAAHRRQIVHRDVKPQNVLVGRDGSIKLTDFGIASVYKDINDERLTTTGMTLGTVQYYAPEQAQGEIVSPAADVYALGIVMYEMLTGRTPFDGDTPVAVAMQHIQDIPMPPSQLNPKIPSALEDIIMRCLEKVPEMRYRDGNALARAIELLGEGDAGGATLTSTSSGGQSVSEADGHGNRRDGFAGVGSNHAGTASNAPPNQRMAPSPNNRLTQQYSPANNEGSPVQDVGAVVGADAANSFRAGGYPQPSADATIGMDQPVVPYNVPAHIDIASTRPLRKGDISRQGESDESRVVKIVTILILLATLLLLGFSVYLANELGVFGSPSPSGTPTSQPVQPGAKIPDLTGKPLDQARQLLRSKGIQIQSIQVQPDQNHLTDPNLGPNVVTRTDPPADQTLPPGKTITLYVTNSTMLTPSPTAQNAPTAPPILGTTPVATVPPVPTSTPTPTPTPASTPTPTPTPTATPIIKVP
jgi:serine/threonine-protein kinase